MIDQRANETSVNRRRMVLDLVLGAWAATIMALYGFGRIAEPFSACAERTADLIVNIRFNAIWNFRGELLFTIFFPIFCVLLGRTLVRKLSSTLPTIQRLPTYFGIGTGVIGMTMWILAQCGLWNQVFINVGTCFVSAILIAINRDLAQRVRVLLLNFREWLPTHQRQIVVIVVLSILVLFASVVIAASLTPETFYDSLVYHLAIPSLYFLEGGFIETPSCGFSGMPSLVEMIFAFAMSIVGTAGPKLTITAFVLFCGISMYSFVSFGFSRNSMLMACLIFFATPVTFYVSLKTAVEIPAALFLLLATLHLLNINSSPTPRGAALFTGVFYGLAMATKYVAWPLFIGFAGTAFIGRVMSTRDVKEGLKTTTLITAASLVIIAPWVTRNFLIYNNPVHPLMNERFAPLRTRDDVHFKQTLAENRSLLTGLQETLRNPKSVVIVPWQLSMHGETESTNIGIVFVLLAPWLIAAIRRFDEHTLLYVLFGSLWALFFLLKTYARFFVPGFAILSILAAIAIGRVGSLHLRKLLTWITIVLCSSNLASGFLGWWSTDAYKVLTNEATHSTFLCNSHPLYPSPYYETALWINEHLPSTTKLLIVADARGLYYERIFRASSQHDRQIFSILLDQSKTAKELYILLRQKGFTHIVFNYAEMLRLYEGFMPELVDLQPNQRRIIGDFWNQHLKEIHIEYAISNTERKFVVLYQLVDEAPKGALHPPPKNHYLEFVDRINPVLESASLSQMHE